VVLRGSGSIDIDEKIDNCSGLPVGRLRSADTLPSGGFFMHDFQSTGITEKTTRRTAKKPPDGDKTPEHLQKLIMS
jgi:hypothetical protein